MNLDRRTIISDPTCERCCEMLEHILHALWFCLGLDFLWSDMQFWAFRMTTQFLDFKELLSWILKEHQHPKLFAFMVWSRNQRNQTWVSQPSYSLHQLAQVSKEHLDEFLSIHSRPLPCPPQPRVYWKPPPNDLVKINFNDAIFSEVNRLGIGVVVHDKNGLVLASLS